VKRALYILPFFLFVFTFSVLSQTPTSTPPPLPEVDPDVVKISTSLVQLDVVVTDKKGNQVTDLKPEDFDIFVNGKKQDITNFSYIFSASQKSADQSTQMPQKKVDKYSVPPPPAKLQLEKVKRTYAIVVDDLGLSFENVPAVRQSLKKFINEQMEAGDLVAIVRTGSGIGALQSFTSDKSQLLAAADKIRWNPQGRGGVSTFEAINPSFKDDLNGSIDKNGNVTSIQGTDSDKAFEKDVEEFRQENFSRGTLGALNYIIRGMKELPGRKSVMLLSEGFPLTARGGPSLVFDSMRVLADLANRSSVVIYTLDPRGLQNPGMAFANDRITQTLTDNFDGGAGKFDSDPRDARTTVFRDTQQSLRYLAYQTGGLPFVNQNDLNKGLREAAEDQSGYYLLGYQPDSETFDPTKNKFNKVSIKIKRNDLEVRYRSGFFGVTDKKLEAVKKTPEQQIYGALTSPFGKNDITLSLNTLFAEDKTSGTFIRSLVTIDAKTLNFTKEADGAYKANFDLIAMTFGDNGAPVDETAKNYTIRLGEKAYQKTLENGFIYNLLVPIKKAGAYQFRVALRDSKSEKVGSASQFIEVPNLKKNQLTLSSIILDNYTIEQWQKIASGNPPSSEDVTGFDIDTALRQFKRGTILRYDYVIYNAKVNPVNLQVQAKLFRDGNPVVEGKLAEIDTNGQTDLQRIEAAGAITLGNNLAPGNYVLQIIVTDNQAKDKYKITSRWIDFEIIE
jgi:VWFA-related protein